jgi:ribose 5-phosphate isomerase B
MTISIGSDHRGFEAKQRIKAMLLGSDAKVIDRGALSAESCDYPDVGFAVAHDVANGVANRGILFCGSGIGMSITANKVAGVRAALCHDELTAQMSRRHNDANVLCLPADLVGDALMQSIVQVWLATEFEGGRHSRRVGKIVKYEQSRNACCTPAVELPRPAESQRLVAESGKHLPESAKHLAAESAKHLAPTQPAEPRA